MFISQVKESNEDLQHRIRYRISIDDYFSYYLVSLQDGEEVEYEYSFFSINKNVLEVIGSFEPGEIKNISLLIWIETFSGINENLRGDISIQGNFSKI